MAGVIIFLDKSMVPDNTTEIHFFENDRELIAFSGANIHRQHLARKVPVEAWHRTPDPATKAIFELIDGCLNAAGIAEVHIDESTARAFHNERKEKGGVMAEQPRPCPHCQGTGLKISPRDYLNGGGVVLTCQNGDCIARIWGHDEADVIARWNRRTAPPATAATIAAVKRELQDFPESDLIPVPREVLAAFLAEWKGDA